MGVLALIEIFTSFVQILGIIGSINVTLPEQWKKYLSYLKYLRLDFQAFVNLPNFPSIDFRAQYILLTNALPLIFALTLLILFKPAHVVLWYVALLIGVALVSAGATLAILNSPVLSNARSFAVIFIAAGATAVSLMAIAFAIRKFQAYRKKMRLIAPAPISQPRELKNGQLLQAPKVRATAVIHASTFNAEEVDKDSSVPDVNIIALGETYKAKTAAKMIRNFLSGSLLVVLGLIMTKVLYIQNPVAIYSSIQSSLLKAGAVCGWVFFSFGVTLLLNVVLNTFRIGRQILTYIADFMRSNLTSLVLFALALLYLPISTTLFQSINCVTTTCASGSQFYASKSILSVSGITDTFLNSTDISACIPCAFDPSTCPIADSLCPAITDSRLVSDPRISCYKEILPYYFPGFLLMLVVFVGGLPILFRRLIKVSFEFLKAVPIEIEEDTSKKVRRRDQKTIDEKNWEAKVALSYNSCSNLYNAFAYRWRYYKIIQTMQKFLVVVLFVFLSNRTLSLSIAIAAIQFAMLCLALYSRPYISRLDDILSILCVAFNLGNAVITLLAGLNVSIPNAAALPVVLANGIMPSLVLISGIIFNLIYRSKWSQMAKEDRLLKAKQKAEAKLLAESEKQKESDRLAKLTPAQRTAERNAKIIADTDLILFCQNLDTKLTHVQLKSIMAYMLSMGVACFISLLVIAIGVLALALQSPIYGGDDVSALTLSGSSSENYVTNYAFAGYYEWSTFSYNCCCQPNIESISPGQYGNKQVELWKCMSGTFKQRVRIDYAKGIDGTSVRPFCSKTFDTSKICSDPVYNSTTGFVMPGLCNGIDLGPNSARILESFW